MTKRIEVREEGPVTVVTFVDAQILEERQIQEIGDQLFALESEQNRLRILLDFESITYMSSAVLGKFITLKKRVEARGGKFAICEVTAPPATACTWSSRSRS